MRLIGLMAAALFAVMTLVTPALAVDLDMTRTWFPHGYSSGGGACPYAVDNGCSGSTNGGTIVPFFQDANFAFDSAQSGQLPTSPTTGQIAARNALLHEDNANQACIDYACGSADPATLTPFPTNYNDGICSYQSSGDEYSGLMFLLCQGTSANAGATEEFDNYKQVDTAGNCLPIVIKNIPTAGVTGITYKFKNFYTRASGTSCFDGTSSIPGALVHAQSASGSAPAAIIFDHWTCDGNYANAPDANTGRLNCLKDDRSGTAVPFNWPITVTYSICENLGHLCIFGRAGGDIAFNYSADWNNCLSAQSLCHGELAEMTAVQNDLGGQTLALRHYSCLGCLYYVASTNTNVQHTTAFYISSGNNGNTNFASVTLSHALVVMNKTLCPNSPNPGTGVYDPNYPCGAGQQYGEGLMAIDYTTSVASLSVHGVKFDDVGANYCYASLWNGYAMPPVFSTTAHGVNVTTPANDYSNSSSPVRQFWQGMKLHDTNAADGFTDTTIESFGTYSNDGTILNTSSCVPGTNAGCGTLVTDPAISEPTLTNISTLESYAGLGSLDLGSDNWYLSSGSAQSIPWPAQPWASHAGAVRCNGT